MEQAVLTKQLRNGSTLQATFLPEKGMNLISLKWNGIEVIDQQTKPLFEERYAGLGALIGPHFHRRNERIIPKVAEESKFPHIARVKAKGVAEPFSHGIGRYAPWKSVVAPCSIEAQLTGDDEWNGVKLAQLQGQKFKMGYAARITDTGLAIDMSVIGETDAIVGLHYYYRLPKGGGRVSADVQGCYRDQGVLKDIPATWSYGSRGELIYDLSNEADYTFQPHLDQLGGTVVLETAEYTLSTRFRSPSAEVCWQLFHPKDASYVCVEPMSAANPRKPVLSVSRLSVELEISPPK